MFFDPNEFPFVSILETHWQDIRHEVGRLNSNDYIAWPENFLYGERGWDVFALHADGERISKHCAMCPKTTEFLERIPGLVMAGFSSIAPSTHIKPHKGTSDAVLHCHLGLIIPPKTGLRVGNEVRQWEEGKCVIFDDTAEHETWNKSNRVRIILIVEFCKSIPAARAAFPQIDRGY
jgi:beta-hydroxylase